MLLYFLENSPVGQSSGFGSYNGDVRFVFAALFELNRAVDESEERVVFADTHVSSRVVFGATLTNDDITCNGFLAAIYFNTETFAFRFAAVLYFTFTFFVCHDDVMI